MRQASPAASSQAGETLDCSARPEERQRGTEKQSNLVTVCRINRSSLPFLGRSLACLGAHQLRASRSFMPDENDLSAAHIKRAPSSTKQAASLRVEFALIGAASASDPKPSRRAARASRVPR